MRSQGCSPSYWDYKLSNPYVGPCSECGKNDSGANPHKYLVIGEDVKWLCDTCYHKVDKKPRPFNRKGRRQHERYLRSKQYKIDQLAYYKEMLKKVANEQVLPVSE